MSAETRGAVAAAVLWCWLAGAVAGQAPESRLLVTTTDGGVLEGEVTGLLGRGREANLRVLAGGETRSVPLTRVLALHGPAPGAVASTLVQLVGGDQLRGELRGGDAAGESFTVQSRSLGQLRVPVDRLEAVVFDAGPAVDLRPFRLPEGAASDEALFRRARRGYDTILGAIHQFTPRGVLFEWSEGSAPELFTYESLAAVALRGGLARAGEPGAWLVTRSGDVLGVDLVEVVDGRFVFEREGGSTVSVATAELAALTFTGADRRYLSDLEPVRVEERGTPFDEAAEPLYRHRRDRAATGGFLVAGGWTHGKGLGTHSRCVLTYRVPEGFRVLHARVGIDDEVLRTPVRGVAEVRIRLGEEVVWGPEVVRAGQPPLNVGVLPVTAGALLTLQADFGDGWFLGDRVDWLSAVLLK